MPIKLDWTTTNTGMDKQNIYRSQTPIDITNLPTPIADVAANVFTYTDNTALQGQLYYYAIGSVKGADVSVSRVLLLPYITDPGPGPNKIIRGDWGYGYFGTLPVAELCDAATLRVLTGLSASTDGTATIYHKVAVNGKIMFFPNLNILNNISWQDCYNAGVAYGDKPVQPHVITRFGTVAQNKIVTIGGRNYRIRLPTSRANYMDSTNSIKIGGEVDTLYAMVVAQRQNSIAGYYGLDDTSFDNYGSSYYTLDFDSAAANATCVARGAGVSTEDRYSVDIVRSIPANSVSYSARFLLELIP